ncbi:FtsX-like permease family protein [Halobaculum magnesiiphilum]|uniref:FtsX-like permease family protein n=1 Tax=Halobaculum magnesiiphilum TaxID=1017351 RepID=A0A8T8WF33_9EURY|nr:FtsX-like permease family protein [Halobaculum magnesiiphilum]QZP38455.1 FtsX-like permease family protein [Halobaculum magnesiiphilum]
MRDAGLLRRWSRRDWLSAAVVTVTTAFLVGTALLLLSAGAYTATLDGDLATSATVSYEGSATGGSAAADDRIAVTVATATVDGVETRVVGVGSSTPAVVPGASVAWKDARIPQPRESTAVGPVAYTHTVRFVGADATVERRVAPPENETVLPARWYAADPSLADELGTDGRFVFDPNGDANGYGGGVALVGALPFLLLGIEDVLAILSLAGVAGAVVVVVVVYNVTQMTLVDRRRTIRVLRSTGIDPVRLGALIAGRATAIAATGVVAGAVLGTLAPRVLVFGARALGVPVSLPTGVTPERAAAVLAIGALLALAGALAGVVTAVSAIRTPPGSTGAVREPTRDPRVDGGDSSGDPDGIRTRLARASSRIRAAVASGAAAVPSPTILDWRTAVPTTATLTVFVVIVVVVSGLVGALAPITSQSTGTVSESGALHPLNSRIDAGYADALREQGVAASPEIIAAQAHHGQPYLLRGANFTAFARVTGAEITRGRPPDGPGEAVIGAGLARTLGVDHGDEITIGGSVSPLVDRVEIVGVYAASGAIDDQLIVPRETIAPGAVGGGDQVHVIRTEGLGADGLGNATDPGPQLIVTRLSAPDSVDVGESARIAVELRNVGEEAGSRRLEVRVGNETRSRRVELDAGETTTVTLSERRTRTGTYSVVAGPFERTVRVTSETALTLPPEFPDAAPPRATLLVPATTENGTPVEGARVTFDGTPIPVSQEGVATVPLPEEPGEYPIRVTAPDQEPVTTTITVTPSAEREIGARVTVEPSSGSPTTRPNVSVYVANPWGTTMERNLTLLTPGGAERRQVELRPGNVSRIRVGAEEVGFDGGAEPGTYTFRLLVDGDLAATDRYTVSGSPSGGASLPEGAGAYAGGTGIGTVIRQVFGNVQVLFAGMVLLAGVSTASGTVATFARAVQARRRTIGVYRATGMTPTRLIRVLVRDAALVATPAAVGATAIASLLVAVLRALDVLVAFGIRIDPEIASPAILIAVLGSIVLAACSVCLAAVPILRAPPAGLTSRDS